MDKLIDLLREMDNAAARWANAKYVLGLAVTSEESWWERKRRDEREERNRYERARHAVLDAIKAQS